MIPVYSKAYHYIIFYNPKSGCSLIRKVFLATHIEEAKGQSKFDLSHHYLAQMFPLTDWKQSKPRSLTIVRNPFARIVSAFLDKCCEFSRAEKIRFKKEHLTRSIHDPIFEFLGRSHDYEAGFTYLEFLEFVASFKEKRWKGLNFHFTPQFDDRYNLDLIHRLEDGRKNLFEQLDDLSASINGGSELFGRFKQNYRQLEKQPIAKNQLVNPKNSRIKIEGASEMSFAEIRSIFKRNHAFDYSSFYNDETMNKVADLYAEDLDRFGYSFPY